MVSVSAILGMAESVASHLSSAVPQVVTHLYACSGTSGEADTSGALEGTGVFGAAVAEGDGVGAGDAVTLTVLLPFTTTLQDSVLDFFPTL